MKKDTITMKGTCVVAKAASLLGCSANTVYRICKEIKCPVFGKSYIIDNAILQEIQKRLNPVGYPPGKPRKKIKKVSKKVLTK